MDLDKRSRNSYTLLKLGHTQMLELLHLSASILEEYPPDQVAYQGVLDHMLTLQRSMANHLTHLRYYHEMGDVQAPQEMSPVFVGTAEDRERLLAQITEKPDSGTSPDAIRLPPNDPRLKWDKRILFLRFPVGIAQDLQPTWHECSIHVNQAGHVIDYYTNPHGPAMNPYPTLDVPDVGWDTDGLEAWSHDEAHQMCMVTREGNLLHFGSWVFHVEFNNAGIRGTGCRSDEEMLRDAP